MIDIKQIREQFDAVADALTNRGVARETIENLKTWDVERRRLIIESEQLKQERNEVTETIAKLKRQKEATDAPIAAMKELGARIKAVDAQLAEIEETCNDTLARVPNIPHNSVPIGRDEQDNVAVRQWGTVRQFTFEPKPHWEIAEALDILDFERGAKVSGSR